MDFAEPLLEAVFLKRYKRFFADILLEGQPEVAHVANTGSLKSCNFPESKCWVSRSRNPARKLKFSLEALQNPSTGSWVGVNTSHPNALVREAFERRVIPHWAAYSELQSEVKLNAETRLDFRFSGPSGHHYVEVKSVTLLVDEHACFPDAVTERGQKHLRELMSLVDQGHTAEIFYFIQRTDGIAFRPAEDIDPVYSQLLREAQAKGVRLSAFISEIDQQKVELTSRSIPILL